METKRSLLTSLTALVLCFAMLLGTTFAWFTDVATSSSNVIKTGNLDIALMKGTPDGNGGWTWAENNGEAIFDYDKWEPGYTTWAALAVENHGSLAAKWQAQLVLNGTPSILADVIEVYSTYDHLFDSTSRPDFTDGSWNKMGTVRELLDNDGFLISGDFIEPGHRQPIVVALHMREDAGNEYQNMDLGANFDIKVIATQASFENDSFGNDYDAGAEWPESDNGFETTASLGQVQMLYGALANDFIIRYSDSVYALLPAGTKLADGVSSLKFSGKAVENGSNITLGEGDSAKSYDIHIEGIAEDNTQPITVYLGAIFDKNISDTSLKLYHEDTLMTRVGSVDEFGRADQYTYDPATGEVVLYVDNFSVFSGVTTTAEKWDGTSNTSWYNDNDKEFVLTTAEQLAGFRDLVDGGNTFAGKTVKLGADIDLANILFNPIGYGYNTVFSGTFDGNGHTIYNLYQNGWELGYSYGTQGGGLFASVKNATIKNLAINGASIVMECVDMGTVVGYAQGTCHFENIVVTNSKLANYQRYAGGVVGEVSYGPYGTDVSKGYSHTFKNIVVDSSVKISSLRGDFDNACGGVIGGKWGDATVKMENVTVACEVDAFSDVTAAYQWYAYRRCGMLIGHTEQNSPKSALNAAADFLTCENVNVYYGDWVNYTYYQFAGQDSATGQRYPWVRAEAGEHNEAFSNPRYGVPTYDGVKVTDGSKATASASITFNQLYGGGQGVYGTNEHEGVTTHDNLADAKTIYILNDRNWENLKLQYWFANGEDTWTTTIDGISMDNMELSNFENVYRLVVPAYIDGFKIVADGGNEVEFTPEDLENDGIYTLEGEAHEHNYDNAGKCICGAYTTTKWQLVMDASNLNVGDKIVIVAKNSAFALSTTQNTNNRAQTAIVKNNDDTLTIKESVQIITLEAGNKDGTFAFNVGNGYLYAASSNNNYLRTQKTLSDNSSWTIEISSNGSATIKAQGTNTRNCLKYNYQSSLFSCYSSGQQEVVIYKLAGGGDGAMSPHNCLEYAIGATCEDNATCTRCAQEIPNTAFGHDYESVVTDATCTKGGYTTHTCSRCEDDYVTDETDALGHNFGDGDTCSVCGEAKPEVGGTKTYTFSEYTAGTQYAVGEEHVLDENTTTVTTQCYFTSELRIYSSSTHDGYAIIKSVNPITSVGINAGYNSDKLVIYGSNDDGASWTEIATIAVKDAYADYSVEFDSAYQWIKIDVRGSNQVRIKSMTLTTGAPCEHTNTTETTVDATCTQAGSITETCDDCGEVLSTETIPVTEHNYVDGTCSVCGETEVVLTQKTYLYTFSAKQYSQNETKALGGVNWTLAGDGGYWGYDGTKGQQLGSGNNPYKSLTLISDSFSNVSKITINTSGASSVNATLNVYVGETLVETITLTATATNYSIDVSGLSGKIKLEYKQTSSKALYIKSITVVYAQ